MLSISTPTLDGQSLANLVLPRKRDAILETMLDRLRSGWTRWEILSQTLTESLRTQPLFDDEVGTLWEIFFDATLTLESEWWQAWWKGWGREEKD